MRCRFVAYLIWSVGCAASLTAFAQPFGRPVTLQIGQQAVRLPTPEGFVETSRKSQDLWDIALAYSAGDARIAAHFVTDQDFRDFESGQNVVGQGIQGSVRNPGVADTNSPRRGGPCFRGPE